MSGAKCVRCGKSYTAVSFCQAKTIIYLDMNLCFDCTAQVFEAVREQVLEDIATDCPLHDDCMEGLREMSRN